MRNIIVFISLIFVLVGYSCNKEDESRKDEPDSKQVYLSADYVTLDPLGWLKFDDRKQVMNTISNLEVSNDAYEDSYSTCLANYEEGMSDAQIDSLYNSCGYIENKPIIDFEASFTGYLSMRRKIDIEINQWLILHENDNPLSFSGYPEHHCDGNYVGAVFNQYGEIQVGNLVYFYKRDGRAVAVKRNELNAANITAFRDLFYSASFDIENYTSTLISGPVLINAFYYGEQPSSKRINNNKGGGVFSVSISIGTSAIAILYDGVVWLNDLNANSDCSYDDNEGDDYSLSSTSYLHSFSKWREFLVLGQESYAYVEYYKRINGSNKRRKHRMGVYVITPLVHGDGNTPCGTPAYTTNYIPTYNNAYIKKKKKVSKGEWVSSYHQTKISKNTRHTYIYEGYSDVMNYYNNW